MKAYGGMEFFYFHIILTSEQMEASIQLHDPVAFSPKKKPEVCI
jgi:hypothetical protein